MSDKSDPLKQANHIPSTGAKPAALPKTNSELVAEVAERLALIQGHLSNMPKLAVSGARMRGDYLLVALYVPGHKLEIDATNSWLLDGKDVTKWES